MLINTKKNSELLIFLIVIALLISLGLLFIYSASSVFALEKIGYAHYFAKKQLQGFLLGLIGLLITSMIPLSFIKQMTPFVFACSVIITTATWFTRFATTIHGSSRWLSIGPLSFQPSELLKLSTILFCAYYLSEREQLLQKKRNAYIGFTFLVGIPVILLLGQPDFGMACTLIVTCLCMLFTIRFKMGEVLSMILMVCSGALILILRYPYRLKRISIFLNPWNDPHGAGFQIIQSLIAIGSGGLWGVGISHSKQKFFYLPMQHTDFIFSIIAEEIGFIGCTLIISLYILFLYVGLKIAWKFKTLWPTLFTQGFVILTSLQAIINIAVTLGLVPTKGMGLPFVSYGNSALVTNLCFIGLIINACRNNK